MGRVPGVRRALPGERERFDALVIDVVERIDLRWRERLGPVEYAVEEMPVVPHGWDGEVPLASVIAGDGQPPRVVVFRRPVEHRAEDRTELAALVHAVVAEQVADLLGIDPEDLDAPE